MCRCTVRFLLLVFLAWSLCLTPAAQADITSNLALWLKLDAGTGTTAANSGTSGDTGTLSGSPTWTAGRIGAYALHFANGGSDILTMSGTTVYAPTGTAWTFATWFYLDSFVSANIFPHLATIRSGATSAYDITLSNDATCGAGIIFEANDTFAKLRVALTAASLTGAWHHLAITYNGSGAGTQANFALYLDGVAQTTTTTTCTSPRTQQTTFGAYSGAAAGEDWNGSLDDIRIYSRALTSTEVGTELVTYADPAFNQVINGNRVVTGFLNFCFDMGTTDAYACSLSPAISQYRIGTRYTFRANTINTGTASLNLNSLGAKTITKVVGGITTVLADGDIRPGQLVDVMYDGTNMQLLSQLGNGVVASGSKSLTSGSAIASGTCTGDASQPALDTASAPGTLTTDLVLASFNANVTSVTGYTAATTGTLRVDVYPTTDTINFKICNATSSSITPGAITLNWRVLR